MKHLKRLLAAAAALAVFALPIGANIASATPSQKVIVCKYVGTPGVDETLQTATSVSANTLTGFTGTFPFPFADAQTHSVAIRYAVGNENPTLADCPAGDDGDDETTDVCPNIEGDQSEVPEGYEVNNDGNCVPVVVIVPCEQTEEGCGETPPPPPPPTNDAFIFSTCELGTFVRGVGTGILNITVNGVLTQYNPYDGSDIYLDVVNGDVVTAGFNGSDVKTLTVDLDCGIIVPSPSPTPEPGKPWHPTWVPNPPIPTHAAGASAGDLPNTGISGWLIVALVWFVLAGIVGLFLGAVLKRQGTTQH